MITKSRLGRTGKVTRVQWDKMLAAFRENPTVANLMREAGVGRKMAKRAIFDGWPERALPPFVTLTTGMTTIHKEMAKLNNWDDADIVREEAAKQGAREAHASFTLMSSAIRMLDLNMKQAALVIEKLEQGALRFPEDGEIGPKYIYQLTKSMDTAGALVQKALEVERKRLGEPEEILGAQFIQIFNMCSMDELDDVIKTGTLPDRLMDARVRSEEDTIIDIEEQTEDQNNVSIEETNATKANTATENEAYQDNSRISKEDIRRNTGDNGDTF